MTESAKQLQKLIELSGFQKIQDELALGVGFAMLTVDYRGNPVTTHSCCSKFCAAVRDNPQLYSVCKKCDSRGGIEAARLQRPYIYRCHMGLVDIAIPIISDGIYLGAILGGQILCDAPENAQPEKIVSEQSGLSPTLLALQKQLPKCSPQQIEAVSKMIFYVSNYILNITKQNINYGTVERPTSLPQPGTENIAPAVAYIEQHYTSAISLTQMAKLCEISPSYFCKQFKKHTGENFAAYLNNRRIAQAVRLLTETNHTVASIAFELGFEDCGYFIKVFKKNKGITPQAYRQSIPSFTT